MRQQVAAAPQRFIVGMGDDYSGPEIGPRPDLIEWDGCHCSFRNETETRLAERFLLRALDRTAGISKVNKLSVEHA